jgi:hypothetical protein
MSGWRARARVPTVRAMASRPEVPLGPRLEIILEVAYRARRPVLLEGATGIGKSEIVQQVGKKLGLATVVLDLSLLEPPDLVGLPIVEGGRTRYALPSILPREGKGILMLEELNRAERYIQQPALQLLTARKLHEYELPEGWSCVAAINPETGDYQVTPLDPALRARFLHVPVRADRASFIAWAVSNGIHPSIVALAQTHERILDDVPPRTWTYASQVLQALTRDELRDGALLRDVLSGYLPAAWVEALLSMRETSAIPLDVDVHALLAEYDPKGEASKVLRGHRDRGETDRLDEITHRLGAILKGPEAGVLAARKELSLGAFEALLADLPGDKREALQEALASNATAIPLLDVQPRELVINYGNASKASQRVAAWKADPLKHHRVGLLVTALRAHLAQSQNAAEVRKSNPMRASLGHFLAQIGERWGMPLVDTLQKLAITPIRPTS